MANDMKKEQELFGRAGRKMAAFLVQSRFFCFAEQGISRQNAHLSLLALHMCVKR